MTRYLFLSLLLLIAQITRAQDTLEIKENEKRFNTGNCNAYTVHIPQAKIKDVRSAWKKYMQQKSKINPKEIDGEFVLKGVKINEISSDSLISFSLVTANTNDVEVTACFGNMESVFYSSAKNPETAEGIKSFLRNFAVTEYKKAIDFELTGEKKKLSLLEQNLTDLENENIKFEKNIKANERSIERLNGDIKSNKTLQDIKSDAIDQQQRILSTFTTDSDAKSDEEKKLKSMQKEKKKLEKENESLFRDIEEKEDDNKSMRKKIDKNNEELIPAKKKEIEKQREKVVEVDMKLKNIR